MDKNKCSSCGETKCSCKNKDFTKRVIEIDNPEQITLMRRVVVPASMGDDTTVPPAVGKYKNVLLFYEANSKSYLYSSDGIPTLLANGITDYEQAVNLPEINGHTLLGNKTGAQLGLQDKLTAGDNITIEDNVISATDTTYGPATDTEIGLVKPGDGLEVATDGTLSISDIEQYAHFFDTVADMKAATNLVAGDYARTGGFYAVNDGGGALYKVTDTGTANEMDVIAVGNLYANIISDRINIRQYGCKGTGTDNDTDAFVNCLNKSIETGKEIDVPEGTYLLDPGTFQMVTRNTAYYDLTICGISNLKSIIKLNNSGSQDYLSDSTNKQVYSELNFYRILFTSNTNTGNMFYCYSTGTEKRFRFYECRFENVSNVLYCAGTGNADLHRFENCAFDIYGSFLTVNNSQTVGIELYGSTFHLNTGAKFINYIKGGHIDIYGGEIEHFGTGTDYMVDNTSQADSMGSGNYGIHFNGTRFEFHGGRFLNLTSKKVCSLDFNNCNLGTADALSSGNYYSELSDCAIVKFTESVFTKNLTFHLATSGGNIRMGALLTFTKCCGNDRIYKQVTAADSYCRVISNQEECLAEIGGRGSSDFDWNWDQRSSCPLSATTKTVALRRNGDGTPKAGDSFTFTLPTGAFVKRIKYTRPAMSASTDSYQLHIGNSDQSTTYGESPSAGIFNDAIDIDIKDLGPLSDNVIKVWATGTATNVTINGYAYIEYI